MKEVRRPVTVRIPESIYKALADLAAEDDRTVSYVIYRVLSDYVADVGEDK